MINAKKAREMIEGIDQNKQQLESTFEHLEKMILAACDKKSYEIEVNLDDDKLAYDVKLCLGNKALRKHISKKMEKNGFKVKFEDNVYFINWNDEDEEVEQETPATSKSTPEIKVPAKRTWTPSNVSAVKDEKIEQKAPTKTTVKKEVAPKVDETKSEDKDKVVFRDPILDFSEFDDILKA